MQVDTQFNKTKQNKAVNFVAVGLLMGSLIGLSFQSHAMMPQTMTQLMIAQDSIRPAVQQIAQQTRDLLIKQAIAHPQIATATIAVPACYILYKLRNQIKSAMLFTDKVTNKILLITILTIIANLRIRTTNATFLAIPGKDAEFQELQKKYNALKTVAERLALIALAKDNPNVISTVSQTTEYTTPMLQKLVGYLATFNPFAGKDLFAIFKQ